MVQTKFFCTLSGETFDVACNLVDKQLLVENYPWLTEAGKGGSTLWAWGYRGGGRMGDNNFISRSSPVQTIAAGTNWERVAAGFDHVLATKTDGTLWLWGSNVDGGLGDSTRTNRSSPVQTTGAGTNWANISAGNATTFATKTDGTLWGMGWNGWGQIATNNLVNRSVPTQTVSGGTNWKQVNSMFRTVSAIKTDGSLWLWGFNDRGQLGNNNVLARSSPVQTVSAGTNWSKVRTSGYHTLSIKTDGTLWGMGRNYGYDLGNAIDYVDRSSPVQTATGGSKWRHVSVACARSAGIYNGQFATWGDGALDGVLNGSFVRYRNSPYFPFFRNCWICVELGRNQSTGITADGALWSWGLMSDGGLGNNRSCSAATYQPSPVQTVAGGNNWKAFSVGGPNIVVAIRDEDE